MDNSLLAVALALYAADLVTAAPHQINTTEAHHQAGQHNEGHSEQGRNYTSMHHVYNSTDCKTHTMNWTMPHITTKQDTTTYATRTQAVTASATASATAGIFLDQQVYDDTQASKAGKTTVIWVDSSPPNSTVNKALIGVFATLGSIGVIYVICKIGRGLFKKWRKAREARTSGQP